MRKGKDVVEAKSVVGLHYCPSRGDVVDARDLLNGCKRADKARLDEIPTGILRSGQGS